MTAASKSGLLLFPGAGGGPDAPNLVAVDRSLTALGALVRRAGFPLSASGRPRTSPASLLIRTVEDEASRFCREEGLDPACLVVGGRSMGGRMASMAVAEGLPAAAVLLISYPLHPPGRPDRPRCAHLGQLSVPTLWLSGSRDAFATPEEVKAASRLTVGPASVVVLEGADHGLRGRDIEVAAAVVTWWEAVMGRRTPRG